MKKYLIATLILCLPCSATAEDNLAKIEKLMNYQGLLEAFQMQLNVGETEGKAFAEDFLSQTLGSMKLDGNTTKQLEAALSGYINNIQGSWNPEDAVQKWGSLFGSQFSSSELDKLIDFYSSDIGQKEVQASKKAMEQFMQYFSKNGNNAIQSATEKYIQQVEKILQSSSKNFGQ